jgi:hypothetical protein
MAVQNLIEQHVVFILGSTAVDAVDILANPLIQSLANNSVSNDIVMSFETFFHWDGVTWTPTTFLDLWCFVSAAFQTTIQQNISTLQAAFPQYQISTWGSACAFGN